MARYHINPETGNPSVCRAKFKCRFGASESENYPSKEDARKAYEKKNSLKNLYKVGYLSAHFKELPKQLNVFTLDETKAPELCKSDFIKFIKNSGVNSFKIGRASTPDREQVQRAKVYQKVGQELFNEFMNGDANSSNFGSFKPPEVYHESFGNPEVADGFVLIGGGVSNNAYLHQESGMVYKIPNKFLFNSSEDSVRENLLVKDAYEKLDGEKLSEGFNMEYAETYFLEMEDLNGGKNMIQAQRYLPPEEYENVSMNLYKKVISKEISEDIDDLHAGNVRRHRETGRIVLIDCLIPRQ